MRANFFDIKSNWNLLERNLQNDEFIEAVNLYHWKGSTNAVGIDIPLIETNKYCIDLYKRSKQYDDYEYVQNRLKENYSTSNPYWFCYPGDCVELNSIVTAQLLELAFPEKEWYVADIFFNNAEEFMHKVVIDKKIDGGFRGEFDRYAESGDDVVMVYDLIYPLMPWYGETFYYRELLRTLWIGPSRPISDYWKRAGYTSYFEME